MMTEKERELLKSWLMNEDIRIDSEITELKSRLRYRKIDIVDCIELALLINRYEDFKQFSSVVNRLLHLEIYV